MDEGSIRPIKKWKDDTFTEQQIKDYVAGKTVVLANAKDDQGQPCTKYLKFSFEKGRPLTYSQNPDLAQTVTPSNESRTQLAVNNEGKTNEATKHVKEPLQQGQTAPKDETQQKRQTIHPTIINGLKRGLNTALCRISHGQGRAPFHFHPKKQKYQQIK